MGYLNLKDGVRIFKDGNPRSGLLRTTIAALTLGCSTKWQESHVDSERAIFTFTARRLDDAR